MPAVPPITVALVEDDASIRDRFARVIASDPTLRFAFGAANATDLFAWFADNPVDVLLVDLGLPDVPGLEVIRRCRGMQPTCAVMVITMFGDEANMLRKRPTSHRCTPSHAFACSHSGSLATARRSNRSRSIRST